MNFCLTFDFWITLQDGRSKPLPYGNASDFGGRKAPTMTYSPALAKKRSRHFMSPCGFDCTRCARSAQDDAPIPHYMKNCGGSKPLPYGMPSDFGGSKLTPYIIKTDTARCPFLFYLVLFLPYFVTRVRCFR